MKKIWIGLSFFCLALMSGCNSAETVVGKAITAISQENLEEFQATLASTALDQFGNEPGLTYLERKLTRSNAQLGQSRLVATAETESGSETLYEVPLVGSRGETVLTWMVHCHTPSACIAGDSLCPSRECRIELIK